MGEQGALRGRCPSCADDPHDVLLPLGPDDEHEAAGDRPDGDEAVFGGGVSFVENLEVVLSRAEQRLRLLERDAVLLHVGAVLCGVPGDRHRNNLPPLGGKSMAELNTRQGHPKDRRADSPIRAGSAVSCRSTRWRTALGYGSGAPRPSGDDGARNNQESAPIKLVYIAVHHPGRRRVPLLGEFLTP